MLQKSPFAIHKGYSRNKRRTQIGQKLRSGDLLIETSSALQTKSLLLTKTFLDCPLIVNLHRSLNSCRGVISEPDLLCASEAEILDGLSAQGVTEFPQVHLLPSTSTVATVSEPQPPNPTSNDTPSITNTHQMKTMFTPLPAETCPAVETATSITENRFTSQDAKQTLKDTSDEDMLIYDVAEEVESPQKLTPVNEIEKFSDEWWQAEDTTSCFAKQRNDVVNCKGIIHRFLALVQPGYSKRRSRPSKLRIKFRIRRLGVLYRHARQFLEKAMRRRPEKHHINSHSVDDVRLQNQTAITATTPKIL
ncbi:uncharacterized protein TNCV_567751 [Trichonephila clavipes]|nr:uncharacterized protein TNCV_567751 [Trichonephila clavipes]